MAPVHNVVMGVRRPVSGDRVWLMVNADPYLDDGGAVERVLCTFTNITERRRAESALRESEALTRRVLEAMPGGVLHVARDGTIVSVNSELLRILGTTAQQIVGLNVYAQYDVCVTEDGSPFPTHEYPAIRCLESGERAGATIGVRRPDGELVWGMFNAVPLFEPESHEISGAVVTCIDLTERKHLEEQLRHVQRSEAIARLAGGVAHHFNNLLTVINGYASLILKRLGEDEPVYRDAQEIRRAGERAAELTQKLLAYNRKQSSRRTVVDVNAVVRSMRPMLSPLFGELVRLEIELGADPATVFADESHIEDLLLNLAVNARDAMASGGRFVISTSNTTLTERDVRYTDLAPGRFVTIQVVDTGCGIDPDHVAHIFEPFFTTKDVGKGTGLGLATVHGVVRQHGGTISVASEPGLGAKFTIHLPEESRPLEAEPIHVAPVQRVGRETVLVVEDEEVVRSFVRESLARSGYRVIEAENGRTALDLVARYPGTIDLLVSDVTMPVMGGAELAREVLKRRPRTRILFITGYAGGAPEVGAVADTAVEVIGKPFSPDVLVAKVRDLLDSAR
jgi:PAS domain S-box-containing protein